MYIRTSGKPSKVNLRICKDAIKFFGKKLLKNNMYHKINVTIEFEKFETPKKEFAFCEWEFDNHRPKDFIITVDKDLSKTMMLRSLAHEMVHIKQYATGELKDYVKMNKSKWKGEIHDLDKIDYWDHPWEIEAHGREPGLYYRFMQFLKEQNNASSKGRKRS